MKTDVDTRYCKFYLAGNCRYGAKCRYQHGYTSYSNNNESFSQESLRHIKDESGNNVTEITMNVGITYYEYKPNAGDLHTNVYPTGNQQMTEENSPNKSSALKIVDPETGVAMAVADTKRVKIPCITYSSDMKLYERAQDLDNETYTDSKGIEYTLS